MCRAAADKGWEPRALALADGGEGTLVALGGPNRSSAVTGPLNTPVEAAWRLSESTAVVEMALASGLALIDGQNDPISATTKGTGELIAKAIEAGATEVIVAVGGSATTDGGNGAVSVLEPYGPLDGTHGYRVVVACDVVTSFVDAARDFGPQKGASPGQVRFLTERLESLADDYLARFGTDVRVIPGAGAAGGLAGGLAALGARLVGGFDLVADRVGLDGAIREADLVLTGEGRLDSQSLEGKVVGGLDRRCAEAGVAMWAVVGQDSLETGVGPARFSLAQRFGLKAAMGDTLGCISTAVGEILESIGPVS